MVGAHSAYAADDSYFRAASVSSGRPIQSQSISMNKKEFKKQMTFNAMRGMIHQPSSPAEERMLMRQSTSHERYRSSSPVD